MACVSVPLIAAGVGAAGSIAGSAIQAGGAKSAADQQYAAAQQANANQMSMYQQTRSDLSPFITGGAGTFGGLNGLAPQMTGNLGSSNSALASLLGFGPQGSAGALSQLQNMPGYQFQAQQGQQGLDRSAASKGLLLSGGQLKDSMAYNQGLAQQSYGTAVNQLQSYQNAQFPQLYNLASMGSNAAAGVGSTGMQAATAGGNQLMGAASNAGQATMGGAGAWANGAVNAASSVNNALQAYQMSNGQAAAGANLGAAYQDSSGNWIPGAQGFQ